MRRFAVLLVLPMLAACETPPPPDPCQEAFQKHQRGDLDGAIDGYLAALSTDPAHKTAIEFALGAAAGDKAASLVRQGQGPQALEVLRKIQSSGSGVLASARSRVATEGLKSIGEQLAGGEVTKALEQFKFLLSVARDEAAPHAATIADRVAESGWTFASKNELERAAHAFSTAAEIESPQQENYRALAQIHEARRLHQQPNLAGARDGFVRAVHSTRMSESTLALARAWLQETMEAIIRKATEDGDWTGAEQSIHQAAQLMPDRSAFWHQRHLQLLVLQSEALAAKGMVQAALSPLEKAAALPEIDARPLVEPKIRGLRFRLAALLIHEEDWRGALGQLDTVASLDDKDPLVFEVRARCYEAAQLWRQAGGDYEVLASLVPHKRELFLTKAKEARAKFKPSDEGGPRD